jgi:hypothetical protein
MLADGESSRGGTDLLWMHLLAAHETSAPGRGSAPNELVLPRILLSLASDLVDLLTLVTSTQTQLCQWSLVVAIDFLSPVLFP